MSETNTDLTLEESWFVRNLISEFLLKLEELPDSGTKKALHKTAAKTLQKLEERYGGFKCLKN
jgi:hypothetical protein